MARFFNLTFHQSISSLPPMRSIQARSECLYLSRPGQHMVTHNVISTDQFAAKQTPPLLLGPAICQKRSGHMTRKYHVSSRVQLARVRQYERMLKELVGHLIVRGEIWKLHGNDGSLSSSPISQPHRINKTLRIRGLIISTSSCVCISFQFT